MSGPAPEKSIGYLEGFHPLDPSVIYGWAGNGAIPSSKVQLDVIVNDKLTDRIICDIERKDLVNTVGRFGYAFMIKLSTALLQEVPLVVSVRHADTGTELANSPIQSQLSTMSTAPDGQPTNQEIRLPLSSIQCKGILDGFDPADSMTIHGWAADLKRQGQPLALEVLIDGQFEELIRCGNLRADLLDANQQPLGLGFYYQLPARLFDGQEHSIDVRIANTGQSLDSSPIRKVLAGKPALIPGYQRQPVSAICAIMKDELPFLIEWIAFHKVVGFDEFVLYDNMSSDGGTAVLAALQEAGELTWFSWQDAIGPNRQLMAYNHYLQHFRSHHDWTLFIDLDEFFVPVHNHSVMPLTHAPADTAAIAINWLVFGSSGLANSDGRPVIERFTRRAADGFSQNSAFKSLCRTAWIDRPGIHSPVPWRGTSRNLRQQPVGSFGFDFASLTADHADYRIHHYFTKSRDEWALKKRRGRPDADLGSVFSTRTEEEFRLHDRNEVADETALRFIDQTRAEMTRLQNLPGVAQALAAVGLPS
jgi:hypothetical protein